MLKKSLKIITNLIWVALIVFLLLVGATFLPIPGNYKVFTVQSGSMEPHVKLGSLIFVKRADNYQVRDVITFKVPGNKNTVTHRIEEIKTTESGLSFVTKGDANEEADTEETNQSNVVGKVFLMIPYVGYPIGYAKTQLGFILLVIIPSVIIIYDELRKIAEEIKKKFFQTENEVKEKKSSDDPLATKGIRIKSIHESTRPSQGFYYSSPNTMKPRRKIV
jgi:signal peptidase I